MPCFGDRSAGRGVGALVAVITAVAVSSAARALELCVTCDGPAARYACTFNDSAAQPGDARLSLLCITELAKTGGHASCAVDRTAKGSCGGTIKILAAPDAANGAPPVNAAPIATPTAPQSASPANAQPVQQIPAAKPPAAPDKPVNESPPRTVQEMLEKGTASAGKSLEKTGDAAADGAKATGSALENAGKAVGNAAKKTWNCITSLFGDC